MGNTIGKILKLTIFGESHGMGIGCVLDGFPAGYKIELTEIQKDMNLRRPGFNKIATERKESDKLEIISGVFNGYSTGAPITFYIKNEGMNSNEYQKEIFRPSHADYTSYMKYDGFNDYRGGGVFSGRLTAAITAAGALVKRYIKDEYKIWINSYVNQVGEVVDKTEFKGKVIRYEDSLCVLSDEIGKEMMNAIIDAKKRNDSIGGKITTVVSGLKVGLGEPFFESLESELAKMMFSIPSIKAMEFGLGIDFASAYGSEVNDAFTIVDNRICTITNFNGGILGGISSGMPVEFTLTVKPTASINKEQTAINIEEFQEVKFINKGRHDPSIVTRIPIIVENATAIVLLDMILRERKKQ